MAIYTLRLPGHTYRLNQLRGHWRVIHRRKSEDKYIVALEARSQSIPPALSKRRVSLLVILKPRQRGGDGDAYFKSLLDALVACGMLRDDNRQWCELMPVAYERGERAGMVVTLEDM